MERKDYKLPDPKDRPDCCLVLIYKVTKGVEFDDRSWDKIHFARSSKAAKQLLEACGNLASADACLSSLAESFEKAELGWTLETIVKHAHEWISKKRGHHAGHTHRARLLEAFNERKRSQRDPGPVQEVESILNWVRDITNPKKGISEEHSGNGSSKHASRVD